MAATAVQTHPEQEQIEKQLEQHDNNHHHQQQQSIEQQYHDEDDFILIDHHHNCQNQYFDSENQKRQNTIHKNNQNNRNLSLCHMIELEKTIFCLMFHLIETYYRPIIVDQLNNGKRRNTQDKSLSIATVNVANNEWHCQYLMPSKRIYGLQNSYRKQFDRKFNKNDLLKSIDHGDDLYNNYLQFHQNNIDWQLVFASISGFQHESNITLARQLNFDSLFDLEDVITQSAYLLTNARKHLQLLNTLVLNTDTINYNNSHKQDDFFKLIKMIEKLVEIKRKQINDCLVLINQKSSTSTSNSLLDGWIFFKRSKHRPTSSSTTLTSSSMEEINKFENTNQILKILIENLRKEANAWEELIDIINI